MKDEACDLVKFRMPSLIIQYAWSFPYRFTFWICKYGILLHPQLLEALMEQ